MKQTKWGWLCIVTLLLTACATLPRMAEALAPPVTTTAVSASAESKAVAAAVATVDATATAAAAIIANALATSPANILSTMPPIIEPTSTTLTAAQQIETAVAATLTANPTATPTAPPTNTPTMTPDSNATQTAVAQAIATSVQATLLARPVATTTPTLSPTATPEQRIQNFATCLDPCRGDRTNARQRFPQGTKKVYLTWNFQDFPIGAQYTRSWSLVGKGEWTRYECTWPGPLSGVENIALSAPAGLHSGIWQVTITLNGVVVLREQVIIEGNFELWDPPGLFTACYGTK